jgi:alkylation response protein AidB-like acyl-CoA dehydrogenase
VINGSKIWTSLAEVGDYGLCVARTNWDAPKHSGLSVFMVPVNTAGLEVRPLRMATGESGFCQEFFTDVRVPVDNLLGGLHDGWTVASRLLVHERNSVGGGSQYWQPPRPTSGEGNEQRRGALERNMGRNGLVELARAKGKNRDTHVRQLVAEAHAADTIARQLGSRVAISMAKGVLPPPAGSFLKLFNSSNIVRRTDIELAIAGTEAVVWDPDDRGSSEIGTAYLVRQASSILSGTSEIQRNIISERILGLPREPSPDSKMPFNQVRHNVMTESRQ